MNAPNWADRFTEFNNKYPVAGKNGRRLFYVYGIDGKLGTAVEPNSKIAFIAAPNTEAHELGHTFGLVHLLYATPDWSISSIPDDEKSRVMGYGAAYSYGSGATLLRGEWETVSNSLD